MFSIMASKWAPSVTKFWEKTGDAQKFCHHCRQFLAIIENMISPDHVYTNNYHNIVLLVTKFSSAFFIFWGQAYQFFCPQACFVTVPGWEVPAVLREVTENFATSPFLLLFHLLQRRVCLIARILSPPKIEKDNNTKYQIKIQERPSSVNTE